MGVELLERGAALAAIDAVVAAARDDGLGGGILVRAPAGLGKTVLLRQAAARAAPARVLTARGAELERGFAFGAARQLLARPVADAPEDARARWLEGPAAAAAPLLLGTQAPAGDEWALLHALHWLVAGMAADMPLVLVCDDAHWCDDESLRFLAYLAHRVEDLPVAIVAATRPADPGASQGLLDAIAAEPAVAVHALQPLSPDATAAIVRARVDADDAACAACRDATSGNPFLLGELLGALGDAGLPPTAASVERVCDAVPEGLQDLAVGRLRRLGEDAVALARAVAVLGDGAPPGVVGELAGLDGETVAVTERALAGADVLARDVPLAFVHPLLRGAVLAELGRIAVRQWRGRAAAALAAAGAPDEAVAAQLLELDPVGEDWALRALEGAAAEGLGRGAPGAAGRLFERALAEAGPSPPPDLLIAAGGSLLTAGEPRGLDHMLAACDALEDDHLRGELVSRLAVSMWFGKRSAEYVARAGEELARIDPRDVSLRFRLRVQRMGAVTLGTDEPIAPLVAAALDDLPLVTGDMVEERMAFALLAMMALVTGHGRDIVGELAGRAVGDADAHQAAIDAGYPMPVALVALLLAEAPGDRDAEFARAEAGVRRRGALALGLSNTLAWRALARLLEGALPDAELDARTAAEFSPPAFASVREPALAALGDVLAETGRAAEALELIAQFRHDNPGSLFLQLGRLSHARTLLALGRPAEAARVAEAVGANLAARAAGDGAGFLSWRGVAAEARLALGDRGAAEELAAAAFGMAQAFGTDAAAGTALRILGLATGDIGLLEDAERRLATSPRRLEHARALVDLGAAMRRAGERAAAREPLAVGAELAARCGATVLLDRAQVELRAAGARPRSIIRSGVEALSPSEHRVAELACDGLTNREIAQRLFVSQKTVESQLRAVFRKLDIGARTEIRGVLR